MQLVRLLPDGHRMKQEVDMALDCVSETMTPMHYHLREIIISTYRQVRCTSLGSRSPLLPSGACHHLNGLSYMLKLKIKLPSLKVQILDTCL